MEREVLQIRRWFLEVFSASPFIAPFFLRLWREVREVLLISYFFNEGFGDTSRARTRAFTAHLADWISARRGRDAGAFLEAPEKA
jgi:hypothetical protein